MQWDQADIFLNSSTIETAHKSLEFVADRRGMRNTAVNKSGGERILEKQLSAVT